MTAPSRFLTLSLLLDEYRILRLAPDAPVPAWATVSAFLNITRTCDELSIVCVAEHVPVTERTATEWRILKVHGPFQFDEIGVLASLSTPLATAHIGIFVVSTFDTDYLLVQSKDLRRAIATLQSAGHTIIENNSIPQEMKENRG